MACSRKGGSAVGCAEAPRLQTSDRWLTGRPDLPVPPPPETPSMSPSSAGPRVSATGRREAASGPLLGFQDPIGPTGLAGVLRVPVPIPSLLDDVPTPASAAPGSPSLRNPGTPPREGFLYDTSLTKRSLPTSTSSFGR